MSQEHVFPEWQSKLFPDLTEVDYVRQFRSRTGESTEQNWPGRPFGLTVGDFCGGCNGGWMSRLENEVKSVLAPLILDGERTLTILDQDVVARWATKTALVAGPACAGGGQIASPATYRWFGDHRSALPGSHVWLGRYDGEGQFPISFHLHGMGIRCAEDADLVLKEGDQTNAFHAAFAIGHLALFVFYCELLDGPSTVGGSSDTRTLIWPATKPVYWPPSEPISQTDLETESRRVPAGIAPALPE
jgi:hypothetical protein